MTSQEVKINPLLEKDQIALRYLYSSLSFTLLAYIADADGNLYKAKFNAGHDHGLPHEFAITSLSNFEELAEDHKKEFALEANLDEDEMYKRLNPFMFRRCREQFSTNGYRPTLTVVLGITRAFGMLQVIDKINAHGRPESMAITQLLCLLSQKVSGWMEEDRAITF